MTGVSVTRYVADNVRALRARRRWSARQLADECARVGALSLTRSTIAKIESGNRKSVTAEELAALAQVLEVDPSALLSPAVIEPSGLAGVRSADVPLGELFEEHRQVEQGYRTSRLADSTVPMEQGASVASVPVRGSVSLVEPFWSLDQQVRGPDDRRDVDELAGNIADLVVRKLSLGSQDPTMALTAASRPGYSTGLSDDLVFVLSAFTPEADLAYRAVAAAAKAAGLRAERVKDVKGDYRISEQILVMIRQARLIVADLTHDRPNVYFELGFARGLGKKVITILRAGTQPHFDVYDWAYLEYIDSRPLEVALLERFRLELRGG